MKEESCEPMPFVGDLEPEKYGSWPPLAWVAVWGPTYSNRYGDYLGDKMRLWGYVMWDADRLEEQGGEELLSRQWRPERDPRVLP